MEGSSSISRVLASQVWLMSVEWAAQRESGVLVNIVCTLVFGVLSRRKKSLLVNENHERANTHRCGSRGFQGEALGRAKNIDTLLESKSLPRKTTGTLELSRKLCCVMRSISEAKRELEKGKSCGRLSPTAGIVCVLQGKEIKGICISFQGPTWYFVP